MRRVEINQCYNLEFKLFSVFSFSVLLRFVSTDKSRKVSLSEPIKSFCFHLGKKWNVLRLRVDSINYQADQLILGTIMFTILLFLFPTVALYYSVFVSIHCFVLVIQSLAMLYPSAIYELKLVSMFVIIETKGMSFFEIFYNIKIFIFIENFIFVFYIDQLIKFYFWKYLFFYFRYFGYDKRFKNQQAKGVKSTWRSHLETFSWRNHLNSIEYKNFCVL